MLRRAFGNQRGEVIPGATLRTDAWWLLPATVFVALGGFIVYSTWAALQGDHYRFGPYISPFYSPELFGSADAWFGARPAWLCLAVYRIVNEACTGK